VLHDELLPCTNGLSDEESRTYSRDGWVGPFPLLTAEGVDTVLASYVRSMHRVTSAGKIGSARADDAFHAQPWFKSMHALVPELYDLCVAPSLLARVTAILGPDVIVWGCTGVVRRPGQRHGWHVDLEHQTWDGVSVFVGLQGMSDQSSLTVATGSHQVEFGSQRAPEENDDEITAMILADERLRVTTVPLREGDCFLFHGRLWHRSHNTTGVARTALLIQYARPDAKVRIPLTFTDPISWHPASPPCVLAAGVDAFGRNHLSGRPSEKPAVSMVIPAWNCARTIGATVRAVTMQTARPDELILVDDGSADDTVNVAREAARDLSAIRVHHQRKRLGPAAARNAGASLATSEILCFLDSDSAPEPRWLEALVDAVRVGEGTVAAYGRYRHRDFDSAPRWQRLFVEAQERHEQRYQITLRLPDTRGFVIRRTAFREIGGFNESFDRPGREDVEFAVRLERRYGTGAVALVADVSVVHDVPPNRLALWRKYYHHGRGVILANRISSIPYTSVARSFAYALRQRDGARIAYFAATALARAAGMAMERLRMALRNDQP
jgi:glycosyltransferase involved in cell wall biosynthesis/ectoine hydroxylase-related dioxygenase (phytanoyl-CoA dioxygenase family)